MRINSLLHRKTDKEAELFRVLAVGAEKLFAIDCIRLVMPKWYDTEYFKEFGECGENILIELSGCEIVDKESLDAKSKKIMYERFTVIAGILPFVQNKKRRNELISELTETKNICKQTIRNYLCLYLAYQDTQKPDTGNNNSASDSKTSSSEGNKQPDSTVNNGNQGGASNGNTGNNSNGNNQNQPS